MLKTVELYNFKSHRETKLSFDDSRLHALVGPNSSGKTSVLQALHYLYKTRSNHSLAFADYVVESMITIGQNNMSVSVSGFWREPQNNWEVGYEWKESSSVFSPNLFFYVRENNGVKKVTANWLSDELSPIIEALGFPVYLKLIAANLAKVAYSDAIRPQIEFDGSGLAPNLDYLRSEAPDKFQSLQEMLQRVVPEVKRLGVRRAKVPVNRQRSIEVDGKSISYEENQEMVGQEIVFDMKSGDRIPAHAVSEGTILALGLLTVLMNPTPPNLVLLDDVEQGLHPKAQRELMSVFKEILQTNPNLQIIFSTHSPYIVDELEASQVHVFTNDNSGLTRSQRLDEHPDVEWATQALTTGEFWDAEGEDWILAGEAND